MREHIKIRDGEYLPLNAHLWNISINGNGMVLHLESGSKNMKLHLPISTGVVADLCRIAEVDSITEMVRAERPTYVRALAFGSWNGGVKGIAHLIKNMGITQMDYYKQGDPEMGLMEKGLLKNPPPGLPWTLRREPPHPHSDNPPCSFRLLSGVGASMGVVQGQIVEWLTERQLATIKE